MARIGERQRAQLGRALEVYTEYPGDGHLFTDSTLPDYDEANTELFWKRVRAFLA